MRINPSPAFKVACKNITNVVDLLTVLVQI
jgi:hypothetical protein